MTSAPRAGGAGRDRRERRGHRHAAPGVGQQQLLVERRTRLASAARSPGSGAAAAPHLRGAQHGEHRVDALLAAGRAAEDVQPVADLHVLDLAEVAVDVQDERRRSRLVGLLVDVQVVVQLGRRTSAQICARSAGSFAGSSACTRGVLVEQLLQLAMSP